MSADTYKDGTLIRSEDYQIVSGVLRFIVKNGSGTVIEDRAATAEEQVAYNAAVTAATMTANRKAIDDKVNAALSNNSTYIALASPTVAQTTAQVKALTRQVNGLLRLVTERLDSTADV